MTAPRIYTQFDPPPDQGVSNDEPSKTRQEFLEESDINHIISQYETSGILPETNGAVPQYADLTDPIFSDFQRAQNIIIDANEAFEALPARTRERFLNDPARLIAFVQDPKNQLEAAELGLLREGWKPPETPKPPEPVKP